MCRASKFLPSAPEDQRTNNVERTWQTLSHRMCAMMLNQDNLAKNMGSPSCLRRAPTTMQCATVTLRPHPSSSCVVEADRTLHKVSPRSAGHVPQGIGRSSRLTSSSVLPYAPCHMPTWCCLRGRQLQVRSGVQAVGLELADLTQAEAANSTRVRRAGKCQLPQQSDSNFRLKAIRRATRQG
jgi:hypothetical protein